jgi:hypothetical protein
MASNKTFDIAYEMIISEVESISNSIENSLRPSYGSHIYNLEAMESRKNNINHLKDMYRRLKLVIADIESIGKSAHKNHSHEVYDLVQKINMLTNTSVDNSWINNDSYNNSEIKISDNISLTANIVSDLDEVQQDGCLYYIPRWNHFAFKFNGKLFHGNIGYIYNSYQKDRKPEKIKDCKFIDGNCRKQKKCTFYHNPEIYPNSLDIRNYIEGNTWLESKEFLLRIYRVWTNQKLI